VIAASSVVDCVLTSYLDLLNEVSIWRGDFCARFAEKQCKIAMSQRVDLMARSRVLR
jgi:hypothetical protein